MLPGDIARVTDWQILHLYAGPFMEFVNGLTGNRQEAAVPLPDVLPEHWEEMVGNIRSAHRLDRASAERQAARIHAAHQDLIRVQKEERERRDRHPGS